MSNSKISALPSATTPLAGTEVLPVVQGGITEQVSVANLTAGRDVTFLTGRATGTLTGATTKIGIRSTPVGASDVTSNLYSFYSDPTTSAAAFTLSNLFHYRAVGTAVGAGSTVTNQFGFNADSGITGATNNYGFYGNIASGTGRWNLYMAGTAENYLAGGLTIGRSAVTSPATTDGNVFSGTYTPTQVSTNTNVDSVTFSACQYMRVGVVVTVSGQIAIDATTATTDTVVKMSVPIASNFSVSRQLGGTGSSLTTPYATNNLAFIADTVNDCVEIRLRPSVNTSLTYNFSFTYQVI